MKKKYFVAAILLLSFLIGIIISPIIQVEFLQADDVNNSSAENKLEIQIVATDTNNAPINGDCIIVSLGDVQILIDSGSGLKENTTISDEAAFLAIKNMMLEKMSDDIKKEWDYIVFTHPDEDHIGNYKRVFSFLEEEGWSVGNIIDFDIDPDISNEDLYVTATSKNYRKARNTLVESGTKYFSAASLTTDQLIKKYIISSSSLECTMSVLYNYYDDKDNIKLNNSGKIDLGRDKNLMSVCLLFEYGDQKMLFTGDLSRDGEMKLLEYHSDIVKNVTFYKAGHHGTDGGNSSYSPPSNIENFVDFIRPAYVAFTYEYGTNYPDDTVNNLLKYTDYIFPTYVKYKTSDKEYADKNIPDKVYELYGDEFFSFDGHNVRIKTHNNYDSIKNEIISFLDAKIVLGEQKKTLNWLDFVSSCESRKVSKKIYVYTFDDLLNGEGDEGVSYYNCSLVKYGHYDILIDCGSSDNDSNTFVTKLKDYVVDGKIEYVIATHNHPYSISQLAGNFVDTTEIDSEVFSYLSAQDSSKIKDDRYIKKEGVLDAFEIGVLIDNACTNISYKDGVGSLYRYKTLTEDWPNHISLEYGRSPFEDIIGENGPKITVFGSDYSYNDDENNYSLSIVIDFYDSKMLFVGDLVRYDRLISNHKDEITDITYLRLSNSVIPVESMIGIREFAQITNPQYIAIGTPLYYKDSSFGGYLFDREKSQKMLVEELFKRSNNQYIYFLGYAVYGYDFPFYRRVNGDFVFSVSTQKGTEEMNRTTSDVATLIRIDSYQDWKKDLMDLKELYDSENNG